MQDLGYLFLLFAHQPPWRFRKECKDIAMPPIMAHWISLVNHPLKNRVQDLILVSYLRIDRSAKVHWLLNIDLIEGYRSKELSNDKPTTSHIDVSNHPNCTILKKVGLRYAVLGDMGQGTDLIKLPGKANGIF